MQLSGKLVIVGIVAVALSAAGASWWFRYAATHQAARFWGPEAVRLIRDAPHVRLVTFEPPSAAPEQMGREKSRRDVSHAPGMTHLRHALLETRSYNWGVSLSPAGQPNSYWTSALEFRRDAEDADASLTLFFSPDFTFVIGRSPGDSTDRAISCEPIANGLRQMFAEMAAESASIH